MVTRAELIDRWLEGKMPCNDETRKQFILRNSNLDEKAALITVDWIWNAGFDLGQEQAIKELK
jgi:hypothetical protein